MKDFLQKYHKREQKMMLFLVTGAFVLALGVNMFMFDGTNFGNQMKASLLESGQEQNKSDLYTEAGENSVQIKAGTPMNNLKQISASISYNPENLEIVEVTSKLGEVTILGEKADGIVNMILSKNTENIKTGTDIFKITTKKRTSESTQINVFNANFTDSEQQSYELTTSGITF